MSSFTWSRGYTYPTHLGVDLAASTGTPIHALTSGRVIYAGDTRSDPHAPWWSSWQGRKGAAGIAVAVDAGGRTELYIHQQRVNVVPGQGIGAGDVIGFVDSTGYAFGSHVHVGVFLPGGKFVDPLTIWTRAQLIAGVSSGAGSGRPLTFWGVVTFPEGTILTAAMVDSIMRQLDAAGYFRDDATGIARIGLRSLLTALIGRRWDDQLAKDIARGLGIGADQVAGALGGDLVAGLGQALGGALTGAAWLVAILVLIILGLYVTLSPGGSSK